MSRWHIAAILAGWQTLDHRTQENLMAEGFNPEDLDWHGPAKPRPPLKLTVDEADTRMQASAGPEYILVTHTDGQTWICELTAPGTWRPVQPVRPVITAERIEAGAVTANQVVAEGGAITGSQPSWNETPAWLAQFWAVLDDPVLLPESALPQNGKPLPGCCQGCWSRPVQPGTRLCPDCQSIRPVVKTIPARPQCRHRGASDRYARVRPRLAAARVPEAAVIITGLAFIALAAHGIEGFIPGFPLLFVLGFMMIVLAGARWRR